MSHDHILMGELFDLYGELLSPRQREAFSLRYNDDFSLAEIAEQLSITRQGARDAILHAEEALLHTEQVLQLRRRNEALAARLSRLDAALDPGVEQNAAARTILAELWQVLED